MSKLTFSFDVTDEASVRTMKFTKEIEQADIKKFLANIGELMDLVYNFESPTFGLAPKTTIGGAWDVYFDRNIPNKIAAIKAVRCITNASLKDAKDAVEHSIAYYVPAFSHDDKYLIESELHKANVTLYTVNRATREAYLLPTGAQNSNYK